MVGLEAMAHGIPVVAARHGGIVEWLDDRSGRLFTPLDARALANGVEEAASDPLLGERGRKRAAEHFSRLAMVERVERMLRHAAHDWPLPP